jgi:hypothetical protein
MTSRPIGDTRPRRRSDCAFNRGIPVPKTVQWADSDSSVGTILARPDSLTNLEHWRDLAQAHPWPLGVALLSVLWALVLIPWPHTPDAQRDLIGDREGVVNERVLDANGHDDLPADGIVVARHIRIVGHVLLNDPTVLVANEIEFAPDSRIWAPSGEITVIAPHIVGGVFDVSGANGRNAQQAGGAGHSGENAGIAYIAAAQFDDVTVVGNGGTGGDGQRGYAGAAGRNGFCGPRGFGLAERGKTGGAGGDAGSGGTAALITVWYGHAPPRIQADAGKSGTPGRGGPGGRGGAGCKGVRGSQQAQSAGNEGAAGRVGAKGQPGVSNTRHVDFVRVVDAYQRWASEHASRQVLLEYLRALPPAQE